MIGLIGAFSFKVLVSLVDTSTCFVRNKLKTDEFRVFHPTDSGSISIGQIF